MCLRLRPVARPITAASMPRSSIVCTAPASSRAVSASRARPVTAMVKAVSRALARSGRTMHGSGSPAARAAAWRRLPSTATWVTPGSKSWPGTAWTGTTISGTRTPTSLTEVVNSRMPRLASRRLSGCCATWFGVSSITTVTFGAASAGSVTGLLPVVGLVGSCAVWAVWAVRVIGAPAGSGGSGGGGCPPDGRAGGVRPSDGSRVRKGPARRASPGGAAGNGRGRRATG